MTWWLLSSDWLTDRVCCVCLETEGGRYGHTRLSGVWACDEEGRPFGVGWIAATHSHSFVEHGDWQRAMLLLHA
jgi:hypothetical protein